MQRQQGSGRRDLHQDRVGQVARSTQVERVGQVEELSPGMICGSRYQVIKQLGEGATSRVYLVRCMQGQEYYAMKVSADKELLRQESELLKKLNRECFPKWVDFFTEGNSFLVMEYIEGENLQTLLVKRGRLETLLAVRIVTDVLQILDYLHHFSPPVVYRDIKPANIMIDHSGRVRLVDLGSAAGDHLRAGTYGYAAPEQFWSGFQIGPECDLYAVGKVLAYLLTGKNPCEPPYDIDTVCRKDKHLPVELYRVIQHSLALDCQGRYASAEEFCRDLKMAYEASTTKKIFKNSKKEEILYEKCIWRSKYQRIF